MSLKSYAVAALLCALLGSAAIAAPPTLTMPATVTGLAGAFVTVPATTSGKTVVWYAIDPGLNLFPVQLLKDTRTAVVTSGQAGTYRLLAITATGDELSAPVVCTVVIQSPPAASSPPVNPTNGGVFLYDPRPPVCGPNGCTFNVPTNRFREVRR